MTWPIVPVHLALLSDGKVAAWDGFEAAVNSEHTWDPWTEQFDSIPTGRNLFCAGHITLTDGRLLVVGGHIQAYEGTKDTNLFTPAASTWARGADMSVARWYPTATALPDGRVFVVSGDNITLERRPRPDAVPLTTRPTRCPEIYNPATDTWTDMPAALAPDAAVPVHVRAAERQAVRRRARTRSTRTLDLSTGQWATVGNEPDRRPERGACTARARSSSPAPGPSPSSRAARSPTAPRRST